MTDGRLPHAIHALAAATLFAAAPIAVANPVLTLDVASPALRYFPGDAVVVTLSMTGMTEPVSGFQAFVEFDPAELTFIAASYTAAPFGEPIITPIADDGGHIDLAAGIDVPSGQLPTTADAVLVTMAFTANQVGCIGSVQFRTSADRPPARLTDGEATEVGPLTLQGLPAEPLPCGCACEFDGDNNVDVFDLLVYLDFWFQDDNQAELDGSPGIDVFDLLAYLDCWFPASAGAPCG